MNVNTEPTCTPGTWRWSNVWANGQVVEQFAKQYPEMPEPKRFAASGQSHIEITPRGKIVLCKYPV